MPGPESVTLTSTAVRARQSNLRRSSTGARAATAPFPEMRRRTQRDAAPLGVCFNALSSRFAPLLYLLIVDRNVGIDGSKRASSLNAFPLKTLPTSVWRLHRDNLEDRSLEVAIQVSRSPAPSSSGTWTPDAPGVRNCPSTLQEMSCCLSVKRPSEPAAADRSNP